MAKEFQLTWLLEPLEDDPSFATKRMFGGLAVYFNDLMVLLLAESEGDREWKGQRFDFDIWNGLLCPTDRVHHDSLCAEFPSLVAHPILGKWVFLPLSDSNFEALAQRIVFQICKKDHRFGIVPGKGKNKHKKKATRSSEKKNKKRCQKKGQKTDSKRVKKVSKSKNNLKKVTKKRI